MITYKKFDYKNCADSLVVTDGYIARLYGIEGDNIYLLPRGEAAKNFFEAEKLCKWFLSKNLRRGGSVVAIGGGSVGDLTGFACSIYKRGCARLTHVPTTLIAQIDSAIGGKTAVDIGNVKNAVGTFFAADTEIDVRFLQTLDKMQLLSGQGELFKYRMLCADIDKAYNGQITESVIRDCVEYKRKLCQADPYDGSVRKKLNFGHTVGHAMELIYDLPHGIAVANGLYYETLLAKKLGKCNEDYCGKWTKDIASAFDIRPVSEQIVDLAVFDKKNNSNGICFVLPCGFEENCLDADRVKELLC